MNFTLVDYVAYGIWIIISLIISYVIINKLKLFNQSKKAQIALSVGLILGHLMYLLWKIFFLILIGAN